MPSHIMNWMPPQHIPMASTTMAIDLSGLLMQFDHDWLPDEGIAAFYEQAMQDVTNWRQTLAAFADRRITDRVTVVNELGLTSDDPRTVLEALRKQMLAEGKTVKACGVAVGTVTPKTTPANNGNGTAFVTTILDGYNAPGSNFLVNPAYDGLPSELAVPAETMLLECVTDSAQGYKLEGSGTAVIQVGQAVSAAVLQGKRRYFLGIALKASATLVAASFRMRFTGTDYTAGGSDQINVAWQGFSTIWTLLGCLLNTPAATPSDFRLVIQALNLPTGTNLWTDSLAFAPVVYHGGVVILAYCHERRERPP